jgi:hypothetical protein
MRIPLITSRYQDIARRKGGGGGGKGGGKGGSTSGKGSGAKGGSSGSTSAGKSNSLIFCAKHQNHTFEGKTSNVPISGSSASGKSIAIAYGNGGGTPKTISTGQFFAGRTAGGGTRAQMYGTRFVKHTFITNQSNTCHLERMVVDILGTLAMVSQAEDFRSGSGQSSGEDLQISTYRVLK